MKTGSRSIRPTSDLLPLADLCREHQAELATLEAYTRIKSVWVAHPAG